jgi:hypothetical protein
VAEYGFSAAFLKSHKDVAAIVNKAVSGSWEMDKFLDALRQTRWWKTTSDAQRRYDVQLAENPGEINESVSRMVSAIQRMLIQMGMSLPNSTVGSLARQAVRNAWNEEELRNFVGIKYHHGGSQGMIGKTRQQLTQLAGDYGVKLSDHMLGNFTELVIRGLRTVDDYKKYMIDAAKSQYKAVAPQLDQGFTIRQILDPYLAIAAEELGKNVATLDISNPMWNAAIQYRGEKPVSATPQRTMTNDEWLRTVRTDKRYGWDQGQNAQKAAAVMARELATAFGAM